MPRIAIIGAGPSGLVSAKSALECGIEPIIFEQSSKLGGLWRSEEGSTWNSMRTNLSHFSCMFSDFPWNGNIEVSQEAKRVRGRLRSCEAGCFAGGKIEGPQSSVKSFEGAISKRAEREVGDAGRTQEAEGKAVA